MKQLVIFSFLLVTIMVVTGQTREDKQNVIQQCIDLESLQAYYSEIELEGKKQLFILDNDVIFPFMELMKFGNKVVFMSPEELFFRDIRDYLRFSSFNIDSENAEVRFRYGQKNINVHVELKKNQDVWEITKSDISVP